jgi:D-alanyl-D-alanine carboxypeptidase/D-alanyl-D-alanine-endopeptidase (penicillin-binding protein 4)
VNRRAPLRALLVALATALPLIAAPALADPSSARLEAAAPAITFGQTVTLTTTVAGSAACVSERSVELQWRAAGAPAFAQVAQATTDASGVASVDQSPATTGRYRAVLAETGSCIEAVSGDVAVRVRALVELAPTAATAPVGSCVDLFFTVSPPKPGQVTELQRRLSGVWSTVETAPLNGDGQGRARACVGWEDRGTVRFRIRWPSQDPLNATGVSARLLVQVEEPGWARQIDRAIGRRTVSVSVAEDGRFLYRATDLTPRTPASNEKLLLAMAALDTFGPDRRIATRAAATSFRDGVVRGDLWVLGRGDPIVGRGSMARLADALAGAGLTRVTGRVIGSTGFFERDWSAPGWNDVARRYVNRPTALTFEGNSAPDPERAAAAALSRQLERRGVRVAGSPGSGRPPKGIEAIAAVESKPMRVLLARMLRPSWNFAAEVLGKGLGAEVGGVPGTIAKGAAAIQAWAAQRGASFTLYDSSGLSYANRVTAAGLVGLLTVAEEQAWGAALRRALPKGGQGTLERRLVGVKVRAKTGSLTGVSTLSGWVYSPSRGSWIEFSILCAGLSKATASQIEDRIVRILHGAPL